jgi:dynein light chain 4
MNEDLKLEAIDIIVTQYIIDGDDFERVTENIKKEMDEKFEGSWHCIMGRGFGFEVTLNKDRLIYLCIDEAIGVVLWQC